MGSITTREHTVVGQPQSMLSTEWGPAARAQIQSSPGASALAAPRQPRVQRVSASLIGMGVTVAVGFAGIFAGLGLLPASPLPAVIVMLASMSALLGSLAQLTQA